MHTRRIVSLALTALALSCCSESGPSPDLGPTPDRPHALDSARDVRSADRAPDRTLAADQASSYCLATPQPQQAFVVGSLVDDAGAPIAGGDIIICSHACYTGKSSAGGTFCIEVKESDEFLFHAVETTLSGKHYGDVLFPLAVSAAELAAGVRRDVGNVTQPLLGQTTTLDPATGGTLTLGGGATLSVPPGVAQPPPLSTGPCDVAYGRLAPDRLHPLLLASRAGAPTPTLGVSLVPVGVTFSTPVSFVVPASGLTAGATLDIYRANDKTGVLEAHGKAKVDTSGTLVDESGGGLNALGLFVFYAK
jgi:hypothetical protein